MLFPHHRLIDPMWSPFPPNLTQHLLYFTPLQGLIPKISRFSNTLRANGLSTSAPNSSNTFSSILIIFANLHILSLSQLLQLPLSRSPSQSGRNTNQSIRKSTPFPPLCPKNSGSSENSLLIHWRICPSYLRILPNLFLVFVILRNGKTPTMLIPMDSYGPRKLNLSTISF